MLNMTQHQGRSSKSQGGDSELRTRSAQQIEKRIEQFKSVPQRWNKALKKPFFFNVLDFTNVFSQNARLL